MNQDKPLKALNDQEKQDLHTLQDKLIVNGGQISMNHHEIGELLQVSPTTASRRIDCFEECGLIEIRRGAGQGKNLIIWKGGNEQKINPLVGIVPLSSPLYIARVQTERWKQTLRKYSYNPESLSFIRLKAGKGMGKSSELVRMQHFLETELKQIVVSINLGSFTVNAFNTLNDFLFAFTEEIKEKFSKLVTRLHPPPLETYWKPNRIPARNCELYLENFIFAKINQPKTLILDGIDRVLGKEIIQLEFLNLLRTWNETKMKVVSQDPIIWSNMVIAYSTEPYLRYGFSVSPLQNVGEIVELQEFNPEEIIELARRYGINDLSPQQLTSLIDLIGGHPTLMNRALYKMSQEGMSLAEIEAQATQLNGLFADYLLEYLELLQNDDNLSHCFKQIMNQSICQNQFAKAQLLKAGLIKIDESGETVGCELYKRYLQHHL